MAEIDLPFVLQTRVPKKTSVGIKAPHPGDHEMFPGIPEEVYLSGWLLESISLPHRYRGKGICRKILAEITAQADRAQKWIFLQAYAFEVEAQPNYEAAQNRLIRIYSQAGFQLGASSWMWRAPQPCPA